MFGEISTRSRPCSRASSIASAVGVLPRFSPSASISWTSVEVISEFARGPSFCGAWALCGLRMVVSSCNVAFEPVFVAQNRLIPEKSRLLYHKSIRKACKFVYLLLSLKLRGWPINV